METTAQGTVTQDGFNPNAPLLTRPLGRTGFTIPTFSLGCQASVQWTPEGIDPVAIIVKAYNCGVRYFDTSNFYGPSQLNMGIAFRQLGLTPGAPGYDERRRREVFIASKSGIRTSRGQLPGVVNWTQGKDGSTVVDDLYRSLSQMFGDGEGNFPDGAYLDSMQFHCVSTMAEADAIYHGSENPDPKGCVGSLAVLRDFRDGTNLTGFNPDCRKLIRHIGITGHKDSGVLMYALQRDTRNDLVTLLVPANANDRRYLSHINNVIPVAAARGMGIISMKVFADGVMYGKEPRFSGTPADVNLRIGTPELPSARLVRYPLAVPGVTTNIIGIGRINEDPSRCQLMQNLAASQLNPPVTREELDETERLAFLATGGKTNYFQDEISAPCAPRECKIARTGENGRTVRITWQSALAGKDPIASYEILRDGKTIAVVPHRPQTTLTPFAYEDATAHTAAHHYEVVAIDAGGNRAVSAPMNLVSIG